MLYGRRCIYNSVVSFRVEACTSKEWSDIARQMKLTILNVLFARESAPQAIAETESKVAPVVTPESQAFAPESLLSTLTLVQKYLLFVTISIPFIYRLYCILA